MADEETTDEAKTTTHTVVKPLLLPRRRTDMLDENGTHLGVHVPQDAIEVFDRDGNPLGHRVDPGQEIRAVQRPGETVTVEAGLGSKLVKAGVVAAPGADNVPDLIHAAYGAETFDAESLVG